MERITWKEFQSWKEYEEKEGCDVDRSIIGRFIWWKDLTTKRFDYRERKIDNGVIYFVDVR